MGDFNYKNIAILESLDNTEYMTMKSIWTRVRSYDFRSDPAIQSGGGEGTAPALSITPSETSNFSVKSNEFQPAQEVITESPEASGAASGTTNLKEVKEAPKVDAVKSEPTEAVTNGDQKDAKREQELLKKIEELEQVKNERSEDAIKLQLKVREEEVDLLKATVKNLETELQAALSKPGGKNHEMIENIKQQHEELLSKARGMIFDKTKMVKNQELQIEALTTQVQSLKDINTITKDLLEIRNSEVKAMEDRLQAMEARFKAEKERFTLILQRAQTSTDINVDLRREYETQLNLFKELREKYEQRVQALVDENNRLKESLQKPTT
ncbi:epidermal growth factor receptor substrate 15 homolog isoform X2 [Hyposmocoma kahamanoa]|uniref:epidermal growth factor receptor substrate 15 homolog isoform X2 n=1 Tax=Hyposmocoma kahamanoa TaxID=1477025 RepID=UPI000E6D831B|nr:epidermal growth factor receptor substrate 15 homolog isoform X2 [Hyposmocoma kahamanoa]